MSMGTFGGAGSMELGFKLEGRPYFVVCILDDDGRVVWHSRLARSPNGKEDISGHYIWEWAADDEQRIKMQTAIGQAWVVGPQRVEHVAVTNEVDGLVGFVMSFEKVRIGDTPVIVSMAKNRDPALERLSEREREVLWLGTRLTAEQISNHLGIARSTVDNIRNSAATKLQITGPALIQWAVENL